MPTIEHITVNNTAYDIGGTNYSAGTGIDITNDTISVNCILYGTSDPTSSVGNDGDIYIKYES